VLQMTLVGLINLELILMLLTVVVNYGLVQIVVIVGRTTPVQIGCLKNGALNK